MKTLHNILISILISCLMLCAGCTWFQPSEHSGLPLFFTHYDPEENLLEIDLAQDEGYAVTKIGLAYRLGVYTSLYQPQGFYEVEVDSSSKLVVDLDDFPFIGNGYETQLESYLELSNHNLRFERLGPSLQVYAKDTLTLEAEDEAPGAWNLAHKQVTSATSFVMDFYQDQVVIVNAKGEVSLYNELEDTLVRREGLPTIQAQYGSAPSISVKDEGMYAIFHGSDQLWYYSFPAQQWEIVSRLPLGRPTFHHKIEVVGENLFMFPVGLVPFDYYYFHFDISQGVWDILSVSRMIEGERNRIRQVRSYQDEVYILFEDLGVFRFDQELFELEEVALFTETMPIQLDLTVSREGVSVVAKNASIGIQAWNYDESLGQWRPGPAPPVPNSISAGKRDLVSTPDGTPWLGAHFQSFFYIWKKAPK